MPQAYAVLYCKSTVTCYNARACARIRARNRGSSSQEQGRAGARSSLRADGAFVLVVWPRREAGGTRGCWYSAGAGAGVPGACGAGGGADGVTFDPESGG